MMYKTSGKWTADENRRLLKLKEQGKHVAVIAKEMGRTEAAVSGRFSWLRRQDRTVSQALLPSNL